MVAERFITKVKDFNVQKKKEDPEFNAMHLYIIAYPHFDPTGTWVRNGELRFTNDCSTEMKNILTAFWREAEAEVV